MARPLRWHRSDGSSWETNGGRHLGAKLADASIVARHENRVLTNQSSPPRPYAISWMATSPVTWLLRGRKQASWKDEGGGPKGSEEGARCSSSFVLPPSSFRRSRPATSGTS